jgi:hypothetical protein
MIFRTKEFNASIDPKQILTIGKDGKMYLGGSLVTDVEQGSLKSEAIALKNMKLWSIFQETIKDKAIRTMVTESKNFDDMKSGKLMLHNLDILNTIVDTALK